LLLEKDAEGNFLDNNQLMWASHLIICQLSWQHLVLASGNLLSSEW
jgi:hypothetical protein